MPTELEKLVSSRQSFLAWAQSYSKSSDQSFLSRGAVSVSYFAAQIIGGWKHGTTAEHINIYLKASILRNYGK